MEPNNFNQLINVPAGLGQGTDVSHYDTNIDWPSIVANGITFSYMKISDGIGTPDTTATANANNALNNGLQIGYYHFCRPKTRGGTVAEAAIAEATDTIGILNNLPPATLPLALDLEDIPAEGWDSPLGPDDYLLWITTFIATLPAGTPVMIYSRKEYLDRKLPPAHTLGAYPLWLALYSDDFNDAVCPTGWNDWSIWQFTENGVVGASVNLDLNIKK